MLTAIAAGVLIGHFYPSTGEAIKPLGDGFIKLIEMLIAPIIFVTVVHGIASMGDLKKVGRVGLKALVYFEIVTTLALAIGLVVGDGVATIIIAKSEDALDEAAFARELGGHAAVLTQPS